MFTSPKIKSPRQTAISQMMPPSALQSPSFNLDPRGNTIVSRITGNLGTLKTLSNASKPQRPADFSLFTHLQKHQKGIPLVKNYKDLREAVLELYLSVKIRNDDEIDAYNEDLFGLEKQEMSRVDGYQLVDMIKQCIEVLMNMKQDESEAGQSYQESEVQ